VENQAIFQAAESGRGSGSTMDARTPQASLKARLPSRLMTEGLRLALCVATRSTNVAQLPDIADQSGIGVAIFRAAEIFKKTPCVAGLKPGGRDVAKDIPEIGGMPFPMKRLLHPDVKLTDAELAGRKTNWLSRVTNHTTDALWTYAQQVGTAVDHAVTHPGGVHEKQCYADI
jgi:dihydroxyacid dehydratase/phosphogluconate dehydratase